MRQISGDVGHVEDIVSHGTGNAVGQRSGEPRLICDLREEKCVLTAVMRVVLKLPFTVAAVELLHSCGGVVVPVLAR